MWAPAHGTFSPLPVAQPARGGGSFSSGLPFLLFRRRHPLDPGSLPTGRVAVVSMQALVVFAAISALGGATLLVHSVAPGAMRNLAASSIPPVGATAHARTLVLALLPTEEHRRVVMPPIAMLDAPP